MLPWNSTGRILKKNRFSEAQTIQQQAFPRINDTMYATRNSRKLFIIKNRQDLSTLIDRFLLHISRTVYMKMTNKITTNRSNEQTSWEIHPSPNDLQLLTTTSAGPATKMSIEPKIIQTKRQTDLIVRPCLLQTRTLKEYRDTDHPPENNSSEVKKTIQETTASKQARSNKARIRSSFFFLLTYQFTVIETDAALPMELCVQ